MQYNRSLHDNLLTKVAVAPQNLGANGTVVGTEIDLTDSDAQQFLAALGAYTDGSHEFQFFHGDTSGALVRVPTTDLDAKVAADIEDDAGSGRLVVDDNSRVGTVVQVGYIGGKTYVRCDVVSSGVTTGMLASVNLEQGRLRSTGNTPFTPDFD